MVGFKNMLCETRKDTNTPTCTHTNLAVRDRGIAPVFTAVWVGRICGMQDNCPLFMRKISERQIHEQPHIPGMVKCAAKEQQTLCTSIGKVCRRQADQTQRTASHQSAKGEQ
jgi:hypothetical protein